MRRSSKRPLFRPRVLRVSRPGSGSASLLGDNLSQVKSDLDKLSSDAGSQLEPAGRFAEVGAVLGADGRDQPRRVGFDLVSGVVG